MSSSPTKATGRPSSSSHLSPISTTTGTRPDILFLKQSHVTFGAPTHKVSVFFDECNREVISLTGSPNSKTAVIFQSIDQLDRIDFVLPVGKKILSIKLNSTRTILAYHVEKSNIEFINVLAVEKPNCPTTYELDDRRYMQASRSKNRKLLGFLWTGPTELVLITDVSIEYYHVEPSRRRLRHIKSFTSATNWFVYQPSCPNYYSETNDLDECHPYSILMVSTGCIGNSLQPYMFSHGQVSQLERFEVDSSWHGGRMELFERSITIGNIYNSVRLLVLQHESLNVKSKGAQILIYTTDQVTGVTTRTHTLNLDVNGKFAINILDNLIVVHDQPTRSSFIFDIMIESTEKSDCPRHYVSFIDRQSIRPPKSVDSNLDLDMYSLNWVFFQPNFIIDAKLGLLCTLHLDLGAVQEAIQDNLILLNFLARRKHSEQMILNRCRGIVSNAYDAATGTSNTNSSPLADVSSAFEILSKLTKSAPEPEKKSTSDRQSADKTVTGLTDYAASSQYSVSLYQTDVQREVLDQLDSKFEEVSNLYRRHFNYLERPTNLGLFSR